MRIVVDTGVFSASISRRRRGQFEAQVGSWLVIRSSWQPSHRCRASLRRPSRALGRPTSATARAVDRSTTVVPVSDALLTTAAELRHTCRLAGHALHEPVHANDLWIAASAIHIGAPLLTADAVFDEVLGLILHR